MNEQTTEKGEIATGLSSPPQNIRRRKIITGLLLFSFLWVNLSSYFHFFGLTLWSLSPQDPLTEKAYSHLAAHCASVPPISPSEFQLRQASLAKTLHALGAVAYIAEPGANTQFFANFSKAQWSLSERPLLLIVTPVVSDSVDGEVHPLVTVLTPKFETTRAKLLPIPNLDGLVNYVEWAEEADPYAAALLTLAAAAQPDGSNVQRIFVDNSIRKFIVDGLHRASESDLNVHRERAPIEVSSAPLEITQMRERKSEAELRILKCVNEATVLAIRDVHTKLVPGIRESYARNMMASALGAAGLKDGGCLTLFGENAALPHGSGTDRILSSTDFALFDCTASLHGYYSDVTRTVSQGPSAVSAEQLDTWRLVHRAQTAAAHTARNGTRTANVDAAARAVIRHAGKEQYFTHRLGHGIGLEVHEAPYLRGGSADTIAIGHTFSNEPGVYIEGKFGIRLEDCFYIDEDGKAAFLTGGVGGPSSQPWLP